MNGTINSSVTLGLDKLDSVRVFVDTRKESNVNVEGLMECKYQHELDSWKPSISRAGLREYRANGIEFRVGFAANHLS